MAIEDFPVGQTVFLPGHFREAVVLEAVRPLGSGYECRVRLPDGSLEETVISQEEAVALLSRPVSIVDRVEPVDADRMRLLVESARIQLAYAHDRHFAVSLSGIRTLPHQIEAVYGKMLPQPRLRFLLADDPGAGKTIMAGLLIKELKLREAVERILILCPAPLTIQWQDELLRWFGEPFDIVFAAVDQYQLVNPWQRSSQVISSIDYAKQDDVRERVWQQRWDLLVVDEAHKCSAYTKQRSGRSAEVEKTHRYQLAERLTALADHVVLLTATPHHGDEDRFGHFVRLIDPDVFPEPHRLGEEASVIRKSVLRLTPDCPWALRRLKEDLRDLEGRRLFPDRHAQTVTFCLSEDEYDLYKAVTAYINQFMPQTTGRRRHSVALARTVLQRRLASSTRAIHESLKRRLNKQRELLEELESLPPAQRAKRLAALERRLPDVEQDEDDLDEAARDALIDEFSASTQLEELKAEVLALQELAERARRVRDQARDSKLAALRECLEGAQFAELRDGRGKLIIFTEHRDTLNHLREHLHRWRYSTCEIHGAMNPHERRRAQEEFRRAAQICVATEAAGEGINLQFCHLMINYDMPWNPTRLEQRLGRIHRIGQERDVYAFNFVATASEEGQPVVEGVILERLLKKLEQMREALGGRVFDVIGQVLSLNDVNLAEMLRQGAYDPRRLDEYIDEIERIDPNKLKEYEEATGIALARASVDFSAFQTANYEAEERRLMPKHVERHFGQAAREVGLRLETRADGLWRVEHVPAELRSEKLSSVRRLGKPEAAYRKITFHKQHLDMEQHLDAVLLGPGHPLYASVDERLREKLADVRGQVAAFTDPFATRPYLLHFFEMSIRGLNTRGEQLTAFEELVAVREEEGRFELASPDMLLDLPAHPAAPASLERPNPQAAADYLKSGYQLEKRSQVQTERARFADVAREYLERSFAARSKAAQERIMGLMARERESPEVALARQRAERDLADLEATRRERLAGLENLSIARSGPVRHVATALVLAPDASVDAQVAAIAEELDPELRRRSEIAAEDFVVRHEEARGWECQRVGHLKIGFDIRSLSPADPQTGHRLVRRIEVKGRSRGLPVRLSTNEWYFACNNPDTSWLYVVWDPLGDHAELHAVPNPAVALDYAKREVISARFYEIAADAIARAANRPE
jgi:superfamily II DNA or RNA helicase